MMKTTLGTIALLVTLVVLPVPFALAQAPEGSVGEPPTQSAADLLQDATGSQAWRDMVMSIHERGQKFDAGMHDHNRPPLASSTLRVGRNLLLIEDTDNTIYENGWFGLGGERTLNEIAATVYDVLPDEYQFITVFINWTVQTVFAYYMPLANDVMGIGSKNTPPYEDLFDNTEGPLDGFIFMNNWRLYTGQDNNMGRVVWLHEIGHRWGSFVYFDLGDGPRNHLLGRDMAHWSYFMDSNNSAMEGNDWNVNSDGSFSTFTNARRTTYSNLDLYLMGVGGSETVPPFFYINNPETHGMRDAHGEPLNRASPQELDGVIRTIHGERVDVTIDDILAAEGPRNPGVSESQREFRMATAYVVRQGTQVSDEEFDQIQDLVDEWAEMFEVAALNEMNLIVNLDGTEEPADLGFGEPCTDSAQCDNVSATTCLTVSGDVRICSRRCFTHPECGEGYCCDDPEETGDLFCYPSVEACSIQEPEEDTGPENMNDASGNNGGAQGDVGGDPPNVTDPGAEDDDGCGCDLSGQAPESSWIALLLLTGIGVWVGLR